MNNTQVTLLYREDIARAKARYTAALTEIWATWGRPIPLSQECSAAMIEAWGNCRVAFAFAGQRLEARRATLGIGR